MNKLNAKFDEFNVFFLKSRSKFYIPRFIWFTAIVDLQVTLSVEL